MNHNPNVASLPTIMPPRPQSDVFRPRLPLDPFATIDYPHPWNVTSALPNNSQSHVILVLGAPSSIDLAPLTNSSFLSNSLLILATHTPPPISIPHSGPAIIILHLFEPLAVHDTGALRLVSLLERAQRVAHTWRATRHSHPRICQLAEQHPGGDFTRHEAAELASQIPTPTHSPTPPRRRPSHLTTDDTLSLSPSLSASSFGSHTSSNSRHSRVKFSGGDTKAGKKGQGHTIPFTALINFLPPTLPDKSLLKHAVLVTTLSSPFLKPAAITATPHFLSSPYNTPPNKSHSEISPSQSTPNLPVPSSISRRLSRLSSIFSSSASPTPYTSAAPSLESLSIQPHPLKGKEKQRDATRTSNMKSKAHIVHVLPYSAFFPSSAPSNSSSSTSLSSNSTSMLSPHKQSRMSMRGASDPGTMGWVSAGANMMNGANGPSSWSQSQNLRHPLPAHANPTSSTSTGSGWSVSHSSTGQVQTRPRAHKTKLVQSIEQFLLSHAYPLSVPPNLNHSSNSNSPSSRPTSVYSTYSMALPIPLSTGTDRQERGQGAVVPFLVPAGVLGRSPLSPSHEVGGMSIGEMVVLGVLDGVAAGDDRDGDNDKVGDGEWDGGRWRRAWIGDGRDVVVGVPMSVPSPAIAPPVPAHVHARMTLTQNSGEVVDKVEREKEREREEMLMQQLQIPRGFGHGEENHEHAYKGRNKNLNEAGLLTPPASSDGEGEVGNEECGVGVGVVPPSPVSRSRSREEEDERWIREREREIRQVREREMGMGMRIRPATATEADRGRRRGWTVDGDDDDNYRPSPRAWKGQSQILSLGESKVKEGEGKRNLKSRMSSLFRLGTNGKARSGF